ncbi:MAG: TIGR03790 family protein [Acidobacteria bacterium]|nr:TIGR03790 family protein [Acidobacteriota bacterium]
MVATPAFSQSAENVAVVVNDASPASQLVADYYARTRSIPSTNIIRIRTPATDEISRAEYVRTIEGPIAAAIARESLQDRILYIVLTKGVPLRIQGTSGLDGTGSSVDSELTLLYRRASGVQVPLAGPVSNPYFVGTSDPLGAEPFTHRNHDIYLVTRLDAFSVDDVFGLIDKAAAPATDGTIVLDQRAGLSEPIGDQWLAEAARRLKNMNRSVILESTAQAARGFAGVLGYFSWGSNDAINGVRQFGMRFVPGAIAATFVSTDARTLMPPPDGWRPSGDWSSKALFAGSPQTLTGDLIREGVTGAAGHVAEPFLRSIARPEILFPGYLGGRNLAEAFYMAIPHLSWQTVVIGDPLCAPFRRQVLAPNQIEEPIDRRLELPGLFGARRLNNLRASADGVSDDALALQVKAEVFLRRDDKAAARGALERATSLAPDFWAAQLQLALFYEDASEHDRAIASYREVLKRQPDHVVALNNLAFSLAVHRKSPEEARGLARRALLRARENPVVLDTVGWIEHLAGNNHEAARFLSLAAARAPDNPEIRLHAAMVLAELGDLRSAERHLNDVLRLQPGLADESRVKALVTRLKLRKDL